MTKNMTEYKKINTLLLYVILSLVLKSNRALKVITKSKCSCINGQLKSERKKKNSKTNKSLNLISMNKKITIQERKNIKYVNIS